MNKHFTLPGTDNVVDIKKYRMFQETKRLFSGYKVRVLGMNQEAVFEEKTRLKEEVARYPHHMLTAVKVQIFENATKSKIKE